MISRILSTNFIYQTCLQNSSYRTHFIKLIYQIHLQNSSTKLILQNSSTKLILPNSSYQTCRPNLSTLLLNSNYHGRLKTKLLILTKLIYKTCLPNSSTKCILPNLSTKFILPKLSTNFVYQTRLKIFALLRAANTLPHIATALGVGRSFIFTVKKLVESGQGLALLKSSVRKGSVR